ncbi:LpxL/LpxP family acyltransferase [Chitinophagaceae bacterium MMS25-I14]
MPDTPAWEGRSRASTLGYRIFIWLLRNAGIGAAYGLLRFVTIYYRLFVPAAIRPLRYLYMQRLGYDEAKTRSLIKKNLNIFGQTIIDKVVMLAGIKNKLTFTHEGGEHLDDLAAAGKGGILVSAHLGNWEVAGHLLKRLDSKINILMYDGEAEQIKAYMDQFDSKRSFNIIYISEDMSHIYEINAALQRNELICIHADRFRPGNRTMEHEFLGEKALFPAGPFILASKLKAPVCFVFAFKETNLHYHFYAYSAKTYEGRGTTGMEAMLDDYVALVEMHLKERPEQWFNYFDFWAHGNQ